MQLELADCGTTKKNKSVMLPAMDNETGQIFMINQSAFNSMDESEQRSFVAELPTTLMAMKKQGLADLPGLPGLPFKPTEYTPGPFSFPGIMPAGFTPAPLKPFKKINYAAKPPSQFSIDLDVEPDNKPWFAQTPVIIGGALVILAVGYALKK